MSSIDGPQFPGIEDGLVFAVDAGNTRCWQPNTSTSGSLTGLIFGVTGSVNNQTSGSLGKNNSFEFDGTDDWVVLEDTNIPSGDSAFTVTHWAYWNDPIVQYAAAVVYGTKATSQMVSLNTVGGDFKASFWSNEFTSTTAVSTDTWYNVALTYAGGTNGALVLYVNGVSIKTGTTTLNINFTPSVNYTKGINLGGFEDYTYDFNGNVACAYVYNRALSAAEVLTNYNRLKGRFGL